MAEPAQQGYITLAMGNRKYYEMAAWLAASLRLNDPARPVAVICDDAALARDVGGDAFDEIVVIDKNPEFIGCANKMRLFDNAPYAENLYVDSDCLLMKPDMDRHWAKLGTSDFNIPGDKRTSGGWYTFEIADVLAALGAPYIVQMNSGVIYFRKNPAGKAVFDKTVELYRTRRDVIGSIHQKRADQYADEPFFGAAMGLLGVEPTSYTPEEGSLMITTLYARRVRLDLAGRSAYLEKPHGFRILGRLWPRGWVAHRPSIVHFIGLKPQRVYNRLVAELKAGIKPAAHRTVPSPATSH